MVQKILIKFAVFSQIKCETKSCLAPNFEVLTTECLAYHGQALPRSHNITEDKYLTY